MKRKANKYILFSVIIAVGVGLDQLSKIWAVNNLSRVITTASGELERVVDPSKISSYWNGFFELTFAKNEGAFLSLGTNLEPTLRLILLTIIPGLVLVGLMIYLLRSDKLSLPENIAFGLIAAGGIGNIVDRIIQGYVVDFMVLEAFGWHTGVFNIADNYIVIGILLFIVAYFIKARKDKKAQAAA